MARIIFLQNALFEFLGPMHIAALLKRQGHDCDLLIGDNAAAFMPHLTKANPDIIAFPVMTGNQRWAVNTAVKIKETLGCLAILGGPHPTFFPDIISECGIDVICRGEGEDALLELADAVDSGSDYSRIANLWVKMPDGTVQKNDVRPLIEDLDAYPPPDRLLYNRYPELCRNPVKVFLSSRGCPYNCSFCFNHQMMELYKGKGRYVRHRSHGSLLKEIEEVTAASPTRRVYFCDDTFALQRTWLLDFLPEYGRRIALPFHCLLRINQLDEEIARSLADNGCVTVFWGIESGDEKIRNVLLQKEIADTDIRKGAALLKQQGISFRTYNIIGFPGETLKQAFKTVALNIEIGTDFPWCSLFMPYPGTKLADYAVSEGFLPADVCAEDMEASFHISSALNNPDKDRIVNLHKFFQTAVRVPALVPLIRQLIKLPPNPLFQLWFSLVYFILCVRSEGRSITNTLSLSMGNARYFMKSK